MGPFCSLDCGGSRLWGRAAVPRSPTGFYRTLWQAQDAAGLERLYPAFAADCAGDRGIKQKGDHWTPFELVNILTAMNCGVGIGSPSHPVYIGNQTIFNASVTLAVASPLGTEYGWATIIDRAHSPYRIGFHWRFGPPFTWYDLRDMSHFVFSAPPPGLGPVVGIAQLVTPPDAYGDPWLNPI